MISEVKNNTHNSESDCVKHSWQSKEQRDFVPSSWLLSLRQILSATSESNEIRELSYSNYRYLKAIGAEVGKAYLQSILTSSLVSIISDVIMAQSHLSRAGCNSGIKIDI